MGKPARRPSLASLEEADEESSVACEGALDAGDTAAVAAATGSELAASAEHF